jgi:elongation factor G
MDVKIRVIGGSFRDGESSELGYKVAASTAFKDGCLKANPTLLTPIMKVNITSPGEFMGEIIGDINSRKGKIESVNHRGPVTEINAKVPLEKMFGYSTNLRSVTQGRAIFSMQFLEYGKK